MSHADPPTSTSLFNNHTTHKFVGRQSVLIARPKGGVLSPSSSTPKLQLPSIGGQGVSSHDGLPTSVFDGPRSTLPAPESTSSAPIDPPSQYLILKSDQVHLANLGPSPHSASFIEHHPESGGSLGSMPSSTASSKAARLATELQLDKARNDALRLTLGGGIVPPYVRFSGGKGKRSNRPAEGERDQNKDPQNGRGLFGDAGGAATARQREALYKALDEIVLLGSSARVEVPDERKDRRTGDSAKSVLGQALTSLGRLKSEKDEEDEEEDEEAADSEGEEGEEFRDEEDFLLLAAEKCLWEMLPSGASKLQAETVEDLEVHRMTSNKYSPIARLSSYGNRSHEAAIPTPNLPPVLVDLKSEDSVTFPTTTGKGLLGSMGHAASNVVGHILGTAPSKDRAQTPQTNKLQSDEAGTTKLPQIEKERDGDARPSISRPHPPARRGSSESIGAVSSRNLSRLIETTETRTNTHRQLKLGASQEEGAGSYPPEPSGVSSKNLSGNVDAGNFISTDSSAFTILDSVFNLNLRVFPALEAGRETYALGSILDYTCSLLDCDTVALYVLDAANKHMVVALAASSEDAADSSRFDLLEGTRFPIAFSLFEKMLLTGVGLCWGPKSTPAHLIAAEKAFAKQFGEHLYDGSVLTMPVLDTNMSMVAVLIARNKRTPVGKKPVAFSYLDELQLASIGQTVTVVIHQCHVQEHLASMRRNLEAVVDMVSSSSKEIRFSKTVHTLTRSAERMIDVKSRAAIFLHDPEAGVLTLVDTSVDANSPRANDAAGSGSTRKVFQREIKLGEGIVGEVAKSKRYILIDFASKDPRYVHQRDCHLQGLVVNNLLCMPVLDYRQDVVAVLIAYNKPWSFTKSDIEHMEIVAHCAGIVLRKAQMFQQTKDAQRTERAVLELTREVHRGDEMGDLMYLLKVVGNIVQYTVRCEKVTLFLVDTVKHEMWCAMSEDLVGVRIPIGSGISGSCAELGHVVNVGNAYDDPRFSDAFDRATGFLTRAVVCVPILSPSGQVLGVFQCVNKSRGEHDDDSFLCRFNNADIAILQTFAIEVANTLRKHNSQLQISKAIADTYLAKNSHASADEEVSETEDGGELAEVEGRDSGPKEDEDAVNVARTNRRHSLLMKYNDKKNKYGAMTANFIRNMDEMTGTPKASVNLRVFAKRSSGHAQIDSRLGREEHDTRLLANLDSWCFDDTFFDLPETSLYEFCVFGFAQLNLISTFKIEVENLGNFIAAIAKQYRSSNYYHNFYHAAAVFQTAYNLVKRGGLYDLDSLEIFGVLLASIAHDVDHPGTDNDFEAQTDSNLAIMYNDQSVLENHHVATCFRTAREAESQNVFSSFEKHMYRAVRLIVIDAILSTDMKAHFAIVGEIEKTDGLNKPNNESLAINFIIHAADLGNLLSPFPRAMEWTERVMNEFRTLSNRYQEHGLLAPAHIRDLSSLQKQAKLQVDFIDYIVKPLWNLAFLKCPQATATLKEHLEFSRTEFKRIGAGGTI